MAERRTVSYAFNVDRITPVSASARSIDYGQTLTDVIESAGDNDLVRFEAGIGQNISIQISRVSGVGIPCFRLFAPTGAALGGNCFGDSPSATPYNNLPATGTYTLSIFDWHGAQAVGYNLTLQCVSGSCPVQAQTVLPPPVPTPCLSTHSTGSGTTLMKVCISDRGNLVQFESPAGFEHLRVASVGEGYAVCSAVGTHGYDSAVDEQGFGPPTTTQPNGPDTLPLTIVRSMLDGAFLLTQKFTIDVNEKEFTITMTLKNTSDGTLSGVSLSRYFDGDIDNTVGGDRYTRTVDSVMACEDITGHGLQLTASTFKLAHTTGNRSGVGLESDLRDGRQE